MIDLDKLKEMRERADKATGGPWSGDVNGPRPQDYGGGLVMHQQSVHVGEQRNQGNALAIVYLGGDGALSGKPEAVQANADFIAHARQDIPDLLDEVVALRQQLAEKDRAHEAELTEIGRRLMDGTLHVVFCNGDHRKRVGAEGMICNCPLGQEIQSLRRQAQKAEAALLALQQEHETLKAEEVDRLQALARYIRQPGNIDPDDARDACARLLENNAAAILLGPWRPLPEPPR